jgi:thymidine kinase
MVENNSGQAQIIGVLGCMFAGKTSTLLDIREKKRYAGLTDIVFRAKPDASRFGATDIVTHSGKGVESTIFKNSAEIPDHIESYKKTHGYYPDGVFIIEAPFTDSGLVEVVSDLALLKNIPVFYDGLNMTSEGEGFPFILDNPTNQRRIGDLMQISDKTIPASAVCVEASRRGENQTEATRTQWKYWIYGPKTAALNVGGKEKYEARSVKHWQPHPYDTLYESVQENANLEGLVEGYVLDVSRAPASLVTVFRNGTGVYARFAALRDMKLSSEGYQQLRSEHRFIPTASPKQLYANEHSFLLQDNNIVTGTNAQIQEILDNYMQHEVPKLDNKEQQYITEEVERSYSMLFD